MHAWLGILVARLFRAWIDKLSRVFHGRVMFIYVATAWLIYLTFGARYMGIYWVPGLERYAGVYWGSKRVH